MLPWSAGCVSDIRQGGKAACFARPAINASRTRFATTASLALSFFSRALQKSSEPGVLRRVRRPACAFRTLEREAEGVLQSLCSIGHRGPCERKGTFRVLAESDPDVDAALASAGGLLAAAEVADAAPATALSPEGPCCAKVRRCPDCPTAQLRDTDLEATERGR